MGKGRSAVHAGRLSRTPQHFNVLASGYIKEAWEGNKIPKGYFATAFYEPVHQESNQRVGWN